VSMPLTAALFLWTKSRLHFAICAGFCCKRVGQTSCLPVHDAVYDDEEFAVCHKAVSLREASTRAILPRGAPQHALAHRTRVISCCKRVVAAYADVAQFWPGALVATRVLDHLTVARLAKEAQQARLGPHRLLVSFTDAGSIGGRVRPHIAYA